MDVDMVETRRQEICTAHCHELVGGFEPHSVAARVGMEADDHAELAVKLGPGGELVQIHAGLLGVVGAVPRRQTSGNRVVRDGAVEVHGRRRRPRRTRRGNSGARA